MSIKTSLRNFFGVDDDDDLDSSSTQPQTYKQEPEVFTRQTNKTSQSKVKVVPMIKQVDHPKSNIYIVEPRVFSESEKIADYLINSESVLLNFKRMENDKAAKVIDFIAGAVYAIGGDMKQIGEGIFLCTPPEIEITSIETEEQREKYYY